MRRTRTFASTARIALSDVTPNSFLHFIQAVRFRSLCSKHRPMNIVGTEAACTPDHNMAAFFVPFKDGARPDAQLFPYVQRDRDLPLRRDLGTGDCHNSTLPR